NARFRELRDYVAQTVELEKNVDIYNSLKQTQRLEDMDVLVKYLYGRNLPGNFFEDSGLYRHALSLVKVPPFDHLPPTKENMQNVVKELAARLYQSLYSESSVVQSLEELTQRLNEVGQPGRTGTDESGQMTQLLRQMEKVEAEIARPDLAPLAAPAFNLGPAFEQVLTQISTSAILGITVSKPALTPIGNPAVLGTTASQPALTPIGNPAVLEDTAREVRDLGRREHQAYREKLATYGWDPYLRPFLVQKGTALALSPDLKLREQVLADFLRQSTAPEGTGGELDTHLGADRRLVWEVPLLEQAVALYEPYKTFSEHGLNGFPARLREPLRAVAAARVTASIDDLVARAEHVGPAPDATGARLEQDLRDQVDGLAAAAKPIGQLRDIYRRLGLTRNDQGLALLTSLEGYVILRGLDRLLQQEHLYVPRQGSFAAWDGTKPLAAKAFGVGDPAELPAYVDKQRERIAYLATEYAGPVLRAVPRAEARREQEFQRSYERWSAIAMGLKDYEVKKAGNSLAGLEGLVLQDLEEVELGTCLKKVTARDGGSIGNVGSVGNADYFGCTATHLRRDLFRRCYGLALDGYSRIERLFDVRLAGRFPFSDALPGRADAEADPEAIREFFAVFDRYAPMLLAAAPREGELGGGRVHKFVEEMQAVRDFFAPFLDGAGKAKAPTYDVAVDFRVDRDDELDGNQVIRWQLAAGDQRAALSDPEPKRHLRWSLGMPLAVTLGWAKDSLMVPVDAAGQELPDKAAVFTYANRWSLLALTQAHPLTVGEPGEAASRTLEFVVPTKNPATGVKGKTRVFLRLAFHPAKEEGGKDKEKDKDKDKEMPPDLLLPLFRTGAPHAEPLSLGTPVLTAAREEGSCVP
ncbi:MAG TPA: hypothetical protein VGR07_20065, partial [Thermoanaerobaculia bacterium]|nr:hypothetical protein [Thermoanaerobaculia bacterium]